jgi:hypothetical protein
MVERWPLRALAYAADLSIVFRRQLIYNLLADMPKLRPFSSTSVMLFDGFIPSGLVPDDGVPSHVWKLRHEEGGHGPDCFSDLCGRVLFVKVEDLAINLDFLEVLTVKCIITEYN